MNQKYERLIGIIGKDKVKFNEPLSDHTTFKIGGPADLFVETETEEEFIRIISKVRKMGIPFFVLGGGSNILAGDKGFRGIAIKMQNAKCKMQNFNSEFKIYVEAGFPINVLLDKLMKNSVAGLEFMAGIPGTVGGAVRGNAGAWQQNIGDFVNRVKILSGSGEVIWIDKDNCSFDYRDSRFKKTGEIILGVEFILAKKANEEIREKLMFYLDKRSSQPKESSAGCVFVNPKPQSAGELIDRCGLKNISIGGAKISEKHANFIINTGGAKAAAVVELIDLAKSKVKERFKIDLIEEIVRVGEF